MTAASGKASGDPSGNRRFVSVEVVEDGRARPLVEDTRIGLTVRAGQVSASAGCNRMSVQGGVVDGLLTGDVIMTLMSCGAERDAQDRWLSAFLGSGPSWRESGEELRLVSDGTTIVLARAPLEES